MSDNIYYLGPFARVVDFSFGPVKAQIMAFNRAANTCIASYLVRDSNGFLEPGPDSDTFGYDYQGDTRGKAFSLGNRVRIDPARKKIVGFASGMDEYTTRLATPNKVETSATRALIYQVPATIQKTCPDNWASSWHKWGTYGFATEENYFYLYAYLKETVPTTYINHLDQQVPGPDVTFRTPVNAMATVRYDVEVVPFVRTDAFLGTCMPGAPWYPNQTSITETWLEPDGDPFSIDPWQYYPDLNWNWAMNKRWEDLGYNLTY